MIRAAIEAGIGDFHIVAGYGGERLRSFLGDLAKKFGVNITYIDNPDREKGIGLSVLTTQAHSDEKFILWMGDHLVDSSVLDEIKKIRLRDGEIALAVDRRLDTPLTNIGGEKADKSHLSTWWSIYEMM